MSDESDSGEKPAKRPPHRFQPGNQMAKNAGRLGRPKSIWDYSKDHKLHRMVINGLKKLIQDPNTSDTARARALSDMARLLGGSTPDAEVLGVLPHTPKDGKLSKESLGALGDALRKMAGDGEADPAAKREQALRDEIAQLRAALQDALRSKPVPVPSEVAPLALVPPEAAPAPAPPPPPPSPPPTANGVTLSDEEVRAERVKRALAMDSWTPEAEARERLADWHSLPEDQYRRLWDGWGK